MDLFEKLKKIKQEQEENNRKRAVQINGSKHNKRYGTKKPAKRFNKHDILIDWRDDI